MAATKHYEGERGRRYHEIKRGIPKEAFDWVSRSRAAKLQPYIKPSDVVFEYGVGSGWNLAALRCALKLGYDVSEFLEEDLKKRGIQFFSPDSERSEASADVVICHHTLEHVVSPGETLEQIQRILRPEGRLLLFVPFEKERRYRFFDPSEPNHHFYSWNVQTLGNLVTEYGFSMVSIGLGKFGYDRFAANLAARFKAGERGFRIIRSLAHLLRPGLEVRIVAERPR